MKDGDLAHTAWWEPATTADGRQFLMCIAVFGWQPSEGARFELWDRGDPGDKLTLDGENLDAEVRATLNVEGVHELWRDADPQPLAPPEAATRGNRPWRKSPISLWPKSPRTGKSSWKPSKHWLALYQALDAVNLAKVELPNRDGLWLPVRT